MYVKSNGKSRFYSRSLCLSMNGGRRPREPVTPCGCCVDSNLPLTEIFIGLRCSLFTAYLPVGQKLSCWQLERDSQNASTLTFLFFFIQKIKQRAEAANMLNNIKHQTTSKSCSRKVQIRCQSSWRCVQYCMTWSISRMIDGWVLWEYLATKSQETELILPICTTTSMENKWRHTN